MCVTFGGTVMARVVSLFLANIHINGILKYFQNNFYFIKPKETANKLNVLLDEERSKQQ